MSSNNKNEIFGGMSVEEWLQLRIDEGQRIDPEIAEIHWDRVQYLDPYGVDWYHREERGEICDLCRARRQFEDVSDKGYFARNPDSDIWVWVDDLPEQTWKRLQERFKTDPKFQVEDDLPF